MYMRKAIPPLLTVAWALESVAWLGGYLQHRRKSPIGIQVLWRGWLKLESLCEGWSLVPQTSREKSEGQAALQPFLASYGRQHRLPLRTKYSKYPKFPDHCYICYSYSLQDTGLSYLSN